MRAEKKFEKKNVIARVRKRIRQKIARWTYEFFGVKNSFGMPNPAELTLNQSRATSGGGEYGEVVEELAQLEESDGIKTR